MTDITAAIRAWANGLYSTEAGVELLIQHGRAIYEGAPWITLHPSTSQGALSVASININKLVYGSGAWSGGERRVVRIAASLLGGPAVDLAEEIPGLDREALGLVLAAIAHAGGSHEHGGIRFDDGGVPVGFVKESTLYPWPSIGIAAEMP